MDEDRIRQNILEKIEDLKQKIITKEPCPENEQDLGLLIHISDELDTCLNAWYY